MRTLTRRELGRATLARQLLLHRHDLTAVEAVGLLAGLQAQAVNAPYLGLQARLENFVQDELTKALHDRSIVRGTSLRGTQHLLTAEDYRWIRPLVRPPHPARMPSSFATQTRDIDPKELRSVAREILTGQILTRPQIGKLLAERWPGHDPTALGWCAQALLPLLHTPPNGTWNRGGATPCVLAEEWLRHPLATDPDPATLIRRYLAAFGPATVKDLQIWSGMTKADEGARLTETAAGLPELRRLRDEEGRELYDLDGAPLPDPDTPAPPRLLPEFDNLLVGHADRTRLVSDDHRRRVITGSLVRPTLLLDGTVAGTWRLTKEGALELQPFARLASADREAVTAEAFRILAFATPKAGKIVWSQPET